MIDLNRVFPLFGQASDSAGVAAWLSDLSAPTPKLDSGDVHAWVSVPHLGIDMVFTDEAAFNRRSDLAIGEGALLLASITFRSNVPDYTDYAGPLPKGILFGDSPDQVHQKLGSPQSVHPRMPKEFWTLNGLKLCVTYDKAKAGAKQVSLELPPPHERT